MNHVVIVYIMFKLCFFFLLEGKFVFSKKEQKSPKSQKKRGNYKRADPKGVGRNTKTKGDQKKQLDNQTKCTEQQ